MSRDHQLSHFEGNGSPIANIKAGLKRENFSGNSQWSHKRGTSTLKVKLLKSRFYSNVLGKGKYHFFGQIIYWHLLSFHAFGLRFNLLSSIFKEGFSSTNMIMNAFSIFCKLVLNAVFQINTKSKQIDLLHSCLFIEAWVSREVETVSNLL